MQHKSIKAVMEYYYEIPDMARGFRDEREKLEDSYAAVRAVRTDATPGSGEPGKPVERAVLEADQKGTWELMQEITVRLEVLTTDAAAIRECLDSMAGRYKRLLSMRYAYRYSWAKIAARLGVPDSTVRSWHDKALYALGQALDDVPMVEEIMARASRARV